MNPRPFLHRPCQRSSPSRARVWLPGVAVLAVVLVVLSAGPLLPSDRVSGFGPASGREVTAVRHAGAQAGLSVGSVRGSAPSLAGSASGPSAGLAPAAPDGWIDLTGGTQPPVLEGASAAFDSHDGYLVLFGGDPVGQGPYSNNSTWTFQGGIWTNITSTAGPAPSPRSGMAMTYDPAGQYVLAFGGEYEPGGAPIFFNDTWEFQSGHWIRLHPSNSPSTSAVEAVTMTYDYADNYPLLLATPYDSYANMSTWRFEGGNWSQVSTFARPSWRTYEAMTYDSHDGYVLLFGGYCSFAPACGGTRILGDTWTFRGGQWTDISANLTLAPSPREGASMEYDQFSGDIVLFGGLISFSSADVETNQTWSFSAGSWKNLTTPHSPTTPRSQVFVNDSNAPYLVLFEEAATDCNPTYGCKLANETWLWGIAAPVVGLKIQVSPSIPAPGTFASFSETFKGGTSPFSYSWRFGDGGTSAMAAPSHTYSSNGFYNVTLRVNDSNNQSAFAYQVVHVYQPLGIPVVVASPNPAILDQPVNFTSTVNGGTPPYWYGWSFGDGGTGGDLSIITHIYTTDGPFTVTLTTRDSLGATTYGYLNVTIKLTASVTGNASIGTVPLAVSFTSNVEGGSPAYTYVWRFGDGATSSLASPDHTYLTPGSFVALLVVNDSAGHSAQASWSIIVTQGGIPLAISLSATLSVLNLGMSTAITASPLGGHGAYQLAWPGLPAWCESISLTVVTCRPTHTGTYTITASVTDSTDKSASASITLKVNGESAHAVWPWYEWYLIFGGSAGIALVVAIIGVLATRKRREGKGKQPRKGFEGFQLGPSKEDPGVIKMISGEETDPAEDLY